MKTRKRRRGQQNTIGKAWISVIVGTLLIVISFQIVKLHGKDQDYSEKEKSLKAQLEEEKSRSKEIQDYEEYTKTQKFVEDIAKSKLGLVYNNEIVFKKQ